MQFTFQWTPEISVGNEHLDAQHRSLLGKVNELLSAIIYNEGEEKVGEAIRFLDEYIQTHLRDEEAYMLEHGYPKLEEHKQMHESFNETYRSLKADLEQNGATKSLALKVQTHVGQWWMNHIGKADKEYAEYIAMTEK